jgi:hypothetical protein
MPNKGKAISKRQTGYGESPFDRYTISNVDASGCMGTMRRECDASIVARSSKNQMTSEIPQEDA